MAMEFADEHEFTGKPYSIGLRRNLFHSDGDPIPTSKKKIKKRKRDPHKPKGAKSAYIFFCNSIRGRVREANKDKKMTELSAIMGKEWKTLGEEERKKFQAMAAEDKARYKREMESYVPPTEETDDEAHATSSFGKAKIPASSKKRKRGSNTPTGAGSVGCATTKAPPFGREHSGTATIGEQATPQQKIVLLTWNIEAAQKGRSDISPPGWTREHNLDRIRSTIHGHRPDIVALQECRSSTMDLGPDYTRASATTSSHCGYIVVFVSKLFQHKNGISVRSSQAPDAPAVLLEVFSRKRRCILGVAAVHLEPFREGRDLRLWQLKTLLRHFKKRVRPHGAPPLVIAGDTNMRVAETSDVEHALACRDVRTPLTFDTRVNWYHGKPSSRGGYGSRYDRVLLRGDVRQSGGVTLVGAKPVDSHRPHHFLSDHFGLCLSLQFSAQHEPAPATQEHTYIDLT